MNKFYIKTFGCQMNEHDSEKMSALLAADGYSRSVSEEGADLIIINTCSIREKSYQKALSVIGAGKAPSTGKAVGASPSIGKRPILAVTGCVVSHDGERLLKRFPLVDIALGPDHLASLPKLVKEAREKSLRLAFTDFKDISDYEFPSPILTNDIHEKKPKAYVTIMKGCDNTCSFCIVPFVRGKEVSRPSREIIDEIQRLEGQGICEIMLLGQNVNSYGKGLVEKTNFPKLLRLIDEESSIRRIRYTSPHPKDLSDALVEEYGRNEKLCPHIHLPVQSGSNRILKKMRRSYTREVYLKKLEKLRKVVPDIAVTTDIIIGFPGESAEDFQKTLSLMKEVSYDASYSFTFSPRPNTEALQFVDDVPLETKKERLAQVQDLQAELSLARNRTCLGKVEEVLVEGPASGHSPQGRMVNFTGESGKIGDILKVRILEVTPYLLRGEASC